MLYYKKALIPFMLTLTVAAAPALGNDCGDVPTAPEVVDGATTTMEQLVANSGSVKAYISAADTWLDCNEAFVKSKKFEGLSPEEKQAVLDTNAGLLDARNLIGEKFNEEVVAYKAANPQ